MKKFLILICTLVCVGVANAQTTIAPQSKSFVFINDCDMPIKKAIPKYSFVFCETPLDSVNVQKITEHQTISGSDTLRTYDTTYVKKLYWSNFFFTLDKMPVGATFNNFSHTAGKVLTTISIY